LLADTCLVIDLLRNDSKAWERIELLEKSGEIIKIPAITLFELHAGLARTKSVKEAERIFLLLEDQELVPLDAEAAKEAGRLYGSLGAKGQRIGALDALIAGIALRHGEAVITRNMTEFARCKGLRVVGY
jgi:tRNA(fMet)-specific endonuclease VapC